MTDKSDDFIKERKDYLTGKFDFSNIGKGEDKSEDKKEKGSSGDKLRVELAALDRRYTLISVFCWIKRLASLVAISVIFYLFFFQFTPWLASQIQEQVKIKKAGEQ